ncbi:MULTISPECIES: hypothetical protein [unclassified Lactococcus]|nr:MULTISPECIES: hypothetical protein [unclassified Lactococcus]
MVKNSVEAQRAGGFQLMSILNISAHPIRLTLSNSLQKSNQ